MHRFCFVAPLAFACVVSSHVVSAHVVAGDRVFPVTLTFDDPGVGDEATLPQFIWQRSAGPPNQYQFQWEFDKTITPYTALIYNQGWDVLKSAGSKTHTGFENAFLTGKWQAYTNATHEFVASLGVRGKCRMTRCREPTPPALTSTALPWCASPISSSAAAPRICAT